jgi:hypothetical protein
MNDSWNVSTLSEERLRVFRHGRDMFLDHLENEQVVSVNERVVVQAAFEVRMAFAGQRRADP